MRCDYSEIIMHLSGLITSSVRVLAIHNTINTMFEYCVPTLHSVGLFFKINLKKTITLDIMAVSLQIYLYEYT